MRPTNIRSAADAGQTGEAARTAVKDMMHEYHNHLLNTFIRFSFRKTAISCTGNDSLS
jgi:hypothetical protein